MVVDTSTGTQRLVLTVGGVTRYASYVSGAANGAQVFQYTVQAGHTAAGNLMVGSTLGLNGLGNAGNVLIDTTAPTTGSLVRVDASPTTSGSVSYTLTFSENVSGVDAADFNLVFTGSASGSINGTGSASGNVQPLGIIFLGNGSSAPSFIAQVFGSSTFACIFSRAIPGVSEMNVFNGSQGKQSDLNQGLRGMFGAPTLGQQLQQIDEADQRHVRELAMALAQPAQIGKRA